MPGGLDCADQPISGWDLLCIRRSCVCVYPPTDLHVKTCTYLICIQITQIVPDQSALYFINLGIFMIITLLTTPCGSLLVVHTHIIQILRSAPWKRVVPVGSDYYADPWNYLCDMYYSDLICPIWRFYVWSTGKYVSVSGKKGGGEKRKGLWDSGGSGTDPRIIFGVSNNYY